jgi:hypothetical protein
LGRNSPRCTADERTSSILACRADKFFPLEQLEEEKGTAVSTLTP